jgi:hypothetical protein
MDSFQTLNKTKAHVLLYIYEELSNGPTQVEGIDVFFPSLLSYKVEIYADEYVLS